MIGELQKAVYRSEGPDEALLMENTTAQALLHYPLIILFGIQKRRV